MGEGLLFFVVVIVAACRMGEKFDKLRWNQVTDLMTFSNREAMLDDLLKNHHLAGRSPTDIIVLLGQPQDWRKEEGAMSYLVDVSYGTDIDPVYTKYLVVHFAGNTLVDTCRIECSRQSEYIKV